MKAVLLQATIAFFVLLVVMAVVFRSQWARDMLRFARNVAWAYIAMVFLLAAVHVWREGL